nr:unnamed protein product [Callosobruchus chinensis]
MQSREGQFNSSVTLL